MKQIFKLTWLNGSHKYSNSYRHDENKNAYKIYDRLGSLKGAISNGGGYGKIFSEGIDYKVEVCEVPDWEELWQHFELGTWETSSDKFKKRKAKIEAQGYCSKCGKLNYYHKEECNGKSYI